MGNCISPVFILAQLVQLFNTESFQPITQGKPLPSKKLVPKSRMVFPPLQHGVDVIPAVRWVSG